MIAVSYIMKRKIKKIFFEVISNSKIFNINFYNETVNDQDFPKLTGGLDKGGLDNVEYGTQKCSFPLFKTNEYHEQSDSHCEVVDKSYSKCNNFIYFQQNND